MAETMLTDSAEMLESADLLRFPLPLHHARLPFVLTYTNKAGCTSLTKWFLYQIGELDNTPPSKVGQRKLGGVHIFRREQVQARPDYGVEWLDIAVGRTKPVINWFAILTIVR